MKILQICPYDLHRPGGVQRHILSLADAMRRRGHEVKILSPGPAPQDAPPDCLYAGQRRVISLSGTQFEVSRASPREMGDLAAKLAVWGPDVAHYHTIWDPLLPLQLFRRLKIASVNTFHDTPPDTLSGKALRFAFGMMAKHYFLPRLDAAVAVSPAPAQHLDGKAEILPPVTDLSRFLGNPRRPDSNFTVLFYGRLEPRKGIRVLLDAWKRKRSNMRLVIAGSGPLETDVIAAAAEDPSIQHFPRPDDDGLLHLLSRAHLAVFPSPYGESFGIVLTEALAAGLPVIAAANAGYVNVLTGEGARGLVKPGDASALMRKIEEFRRKPVAAEWGARHAARFDSTARAPEFEALFHRARANWANRMHRPVK